MKKTPKLGWIVASIVASIVTVGLVSVAIFASLHVRWIGWWLASRESSESLSPHLFAAISESARDDVAALLDLGASPNSENDDERSAIDLALEKGDPNEKLHDGGTLLHLAAAKKDTKLAAALVKAEANVNFRTSTGMTPLLVAIDHQHADVAAVLIDGGVDLRRTFESQYTALFWAVLRDDDRMVELLLSRGADKNHRSADGSTPLALARVLGHTRVAENLASATQEP